MRTGESYGEDWTADVTDQDREADLVDRLDAALARAEAAEAKVAAVEALDLTGFVDTFEGERREGAASVAAFVKIALRAALITETLKVLDE